MDFLTDEQAEAYGAFTQAPTRPELERFFFLDDADRDLVALRRSDSHRLGVALQICTVRYMGLFLVDPLAVPWSVVEHLAEQLGIGDPSCVKRYAERRMTPYEHAWEISKKYGYRPFEDHEAGRRFRTFLHGRAWTHAEGPVALFDHAVGWPRGHRVLLPGVSVLARQVSAVGRSLSGGCMRRWPTPPAGRTRCCRGRWLICSMCRRARGSRSWSGCGARRPVRRVRRWPGLSTGSMTSRSCGWGGLTSTGYGEPAGGVGPLRHG